MTFYVAYRLKRKNARRRIAARFILPDEKSALRDFKKFVELSPRNNIEYELLTGDWKHIMFIEKGEKGNAKP